MHAGSWKIGRWRLPDVGVTEWLGEQIAKVGGGYAPLTEEGGSSLFGSPSEIKLAQDPYTKEVYRTTYTPPIRRETTTSSEGTGGTGGSVLEVSDEGSSQAKLEEETSRGPSPEELALQAAKSQIESSYQPVFEYLDRLAGYLPEWKTEREKEIESLYGSQLGELETSKQAALSYFPGYREQVRTRSLKDLYQQFRNLLQAGAIRLGAMGAADSAATGAYGALLAKAGARGVTDINRQVAEQLNQINMKEQDVINTFNQQKAQLETWKATEIGKVADWFRSQQGQLEQARTSASGERARALAAAQIDLVNQAISRLNQLDQQARQWDAALREWAINRVDNLQEMKDIYSQLSQWQATPIAQPDLVSQSSLQTPEREAYEWWNPYALARRKEEEKVSQWLKGLV